MTVGPGRHPSFKGHGLVEVPPLALVGPPHLGGRGLLVVVAGVERSLVVSIRLTIIHQGQALFFEAPGPAGAVVPLPVDTLAACAGEDEVCVLRASGEVQCLTLNGAWRTVRRVSLPADVEHAAVSGNGALVVVSTRADRSCDVLLETGGRWPPVRTPEWLCGVNGLGCAADGRSFGYAYLTEQPWSDYGSYGDPLAGAVVLSADGTVLGEEWDIRERFVKAPRVQLAWGAGGEPLVVAETGPGPADGDVTAFWGRSVGGPVRAESEGVPLCDAEGSPELYDVLLGGGEMLTVSPDGDRVGAVDLAGGAWVIERSSRRRCRVASEAIALEFREPSVLGWVSRERVWRREPVSAFEWEDLNNA